VIDPLQASREIAASGLFAQSTRLRIVAENIANVESTGNKPGAEPYRRKVISFGHTLDSLSEAELVDVASVDKDMSAFPKEVRPGHPAADSNGYVKMPNVNLVVEMTDMKQATRSFEANLQVIRQSREMANAMIDLLRNG
jgi:flagellar basal-body rod protein FlgC